MKLPDSWRVILYQNEIERCIQRCADSLNVQYRDKKVIVVGILKGTVFFYVDLVRKLEMPYSCYFIEATSYHNNQTSGSLTIMSSIEPSKFVGRHVILVDELYDNGHTLHEIRNAIVEKAHVPEEMIYTCTLFKKEKLTTYRPPDLYGIAVPDVWLVGYGLDDRQEKRGLTTLMACPKEGGVPLTDDDKIFTDDKAYYEMRELMTERLPLYQ